MMSKIIVYFTLLKKKLAITHTKLKVKKKKKYIMYFEYKM